MAVDLEHDFNGDGTNDALVGAPYNDTAASNAGAAYVVYGPVSGSYSLSGADLKITGIAASDYLGYKVHSDDMNGDGKDDLLITAPLYDYSGRSNSGAVYLFTSLSTGTKSASTAALAIYADSGDNLGYERVSTGDMDGDGKQDLALGSPSDNGAATSAGAAWVLYGSLSGTYDLSTTYGARWQGEGVQYYAGSDVAFLGDTNADGFDDLAIGGYYADERGYTEHGAVWVFLGG
jgi:hypothetical protein